MRVSECRCNDKSFPFQILAFFSPDTSSGALAPEEVMNDLGLCLQSQVSQTSTPLQQLWSEQREFVVMICYG